MSKKIAKFDQGRIAVWLLFLFMASACRAEIFKSVDANGRTQYSERKSVAGDKAIELKIKSPSTSPHSSDSPSQYWQEQERRFQERQASKRMMEQRSGPQVVKAPDSLSGGTAKMEDTDAWRCNLARDILSGAVKRTSGRPTNQEEIDLAKENVRVFCH